jgi:hypothetical protein
MTTPSPQKVAARFASPRKYEALMERLLGLAESGNRLKVGPKTIWAGQGNTSGMHEYAGRERSDKWRKSGPRFEQKLRAFPPGTKVENYFYQSTSRDSGRWVSAGVFTIPDLHEVVRVDPNKVTVIDEDGDSFKVQIQGNTYKAGDKVRLKADFLWAQNSWGSTLIPKGASIEILAAGYRQLRPSLRLQPSSGFMVPFFSPPRKINTRNYHSFWTTREGPLRWVVQLFKDMGYKKPKQGTFQFPEERKYGPGYGSGRKVHTSPKGSNFTVKASRGGWTLIPETVIETWDAPNSGAVATDPPAFYTFGIEGFPGFAGIFNGENRFSDRLVWDLVPKDALK